MNRFLSYVLMPVAVLALLIPVGCNQAPTQAPTSSAASGTNNGSVATTNGSGSPAPSYGPTVPKASAVPNAKPKVVYNSSTSSYTKTEDFYPEDYSWPYEYIYYTIGGLGILPNGNLVVGDYYESQVAVVNPTGAPNNGGELYETLAGIGHSQLSEPYGLAVDSQGNIYVANYGDSNIVKYNSAGTYLSSFSHNFGDVYNVTVDNLGNIYVVDAGNENIQKFDSHFNFQRSWGHFTSPWGIATDGTDIFVADYGTEMIEKYTPNGALLGSITGSSNKNPIAFEGPYGLAADGKGNLFVSDYYNGIFRYNSNTLTFETTVTTTDPFYYGPIDVAVDSQGDVYATDYYYYIYKFVPNNP